MTVMESPSTLTCAAPSPAVAPRPRRAGHYGMLDAWRGVACLWVVCHHAIGFLAQGDLSIGARPGYALALNGALGVWMFFVISGYCIANTAAHSLTTGKGGWVAARVRRIFPPMWGSVVVATVSSLFAGSLVHRGILKSSNLASLDLLHQSAPFILTNLTLTQEAFHQLFHRGDRTVPYLVGVYWTLCYEVGFYAIVALFLAWSRRHRDARRLLNGLHVVTLASLAAMLVKPTAVPYPFDLWAYFGLGVMLFDVIAHGWRRSNATAAALTLAGVAGFVCQHPGRVQVLGMVDYLDRFDKDLGGGGVSMAVAAAFAVLLLGLHPLDSALARQPVARALGWVGLFSYSLYLTHMTLIAYVSKACQLAHVLPNHLAIYLAATVVACVGFAWVFFRACERPFLRSSTKGPVSTGGTVAVRQPV